MTLYTTRVSLYKPGGGLTGTNEPDEVLDVDKLNGNFDLIDSLLGAIVCTSSTRPSNPYLGMLIRETDNGDYQGVNYWNGSAWIAFLPNYLLPEKLSATFYSKTDVAAGALDSRYFTQANLLTDGKLDSRYPAKSAANSISQTMLPFRDDSGTVSMGAGSADGSGFSSIVTVTLTSGRFTAAPKVLLTENSADTNSDKLSTVPNSITATQFQIKYWRSVSFGAGLRVDWFARGV